MSDTNLTDIQADLAERIRADSEFFSTITVLQERKADIVTEINTALGVLTTTGGKIGACVIVMSPIASDELPDVTFGPLELELTCLVLEDVVINTGTDGTGKAALTIARRLCDTLKHYNPVGLAHALIPGKPVIVPVENPLAPLAYEVRFKAAEADPTINTKVSTPTFSPASGAPPQTVTITSATAGASIYYTTNGTHPWSGNAAATLYSTPVSISAATTLRACAFKTGSIPSNVNRAAYA